MTTVLACLINIPCTIAIVMCADKKLNDPKYWIIVAMCFILILFNSLRHFWEEK